MRHRGANFLRPAAKWFLLASLVAGVALLIWLHRARLFGLLADPAALRAWLEGLGPWGPFALVVIFVLQVLVAPIPGYVVQIAAGYLFGWFQGSIYTAIGLLLGGTLAMGLSRVYGRPLVRRAIGADRLERWEQLAHLNSLGLWFLLFLGPFGDALYFVAGLTTLPVWKVMSLAMLVRGPALVVAAAIGSGALDWRSPWVIGGALLLMAIGFLGARYQDKIDRWIEKRMAGRIATGKRRPALLQEDPGYAWGAVSAPEDAADL